MEMVTLLPTSARLTSDVLLHSTPFVMDERRLLNLFDGPPRQQVRRAGDHGLHALLRAAHPERRAPRVPEADAVLGRRGPAGRPAPAQGAAGEGHAGGEGGRSCLPHRSTTSLYHLAIPHRYTASLYRIALPHRSTPSVYHVALPHRYTASASAAACQTR